MATQVYNGTVTAVAQVQTVKIDVWDAAGVYTITVGIAPNTVTISVDDDTDEDTTAANLRAAFVLSTHPYITAISSSVTTDTITLTATTAGSPFTLSSSASGGAAAMTDATLTTNDGPNVFDSAANWASGTAPSNSDTIYMEPGSPPICWNIDTSLTGITLNVPDGIGNIGLDSTAFATSADGATVNTAKVEYRETYLKMDWTECNIGQADGPSSVTSPTRLMLWNELAGSSQTHVYAVPGVSADAGKPTLRLHTIHVNANILVFSAIGGWGLAIDKKGEVSTVGSVGVFSESSATKTFFGDGVTVTTFEQLNGTAIIRAAGDISVINVHGGSVSTEGVGWKIGTLTHNGGTTEISNSNAGVAITLLEGNGGLVRVPRAPNSVGGITITTLTPRTGFKIEALDNNFGIDTLNNPLGLYTMAWS